MTAVIVPKDPSLLKTKDMDLKRVIWTPKQVKFVNKLIKYCKEHLAGFEASKNVIFVNEMPKIQKYQLREKYRDLYKAEK